MASHLEISLLQAVFNHLVLPTRLPGRQDPNIEVVSQDVLTRLMSTCDAIIPLVGPPWSLAYQSVRSSLEACRALNSGRLEKTTIQRYLGQLQPSNMLILHVVEQNAALLIRREDCDHDQRIIFEAFEASASSEQVLAAGHALQWDFPGRSAQVRIADLADGAFQESLVTFLEQASAESLYSLRASARKANVCVSETRDTTDPSLITQMLIPLLEAVGSHFQAPVLRKRIRDEVNVEEAELPWRRLPFWLVLRVATQRQLCLTLGNESGRIGYKALMCFLLARLLQDSTGNLSPELVTTLRAKLCRRMAKLENDKASMISNQAGIYESLFGHISPIIKAVVEEATVSIEIEWENFKKDTTRRIPILPKFAPESSVNLTLNSSGAYLDDLLRYQPPPPVNHASVELPQPLEKAIRDSQRFTDSIFRLVEMETRASRVEWAELRSSHDYEAQCLELTAQIDRLLTQAGPTSNSDPEQTSAMILALFNLWVCLDRCAIAACPLLQDHRPVFNPELLDVLQVPTLSKMCLLQSIQTYLYQRRRGSRYDTILSKLDENCVAVRYVAHSAEMEALGTCIQIASDQAFDTKASEWQMKCDEYDELTIEISENTCRCTWIDGQRDSRGCEKCYLERVRNRIEIQIQEAFLPKSNTARAAVIFELSIPPYLSAYRNTTWRILSSLAHPSRPASSPKPVIALDDYRPLQDFSTADSMGLSLASTIKCFSQTHYRFYREKVPLSRVLLPFAAAFKLYDNVSNLWVEDLQQAPTFQHLCGVHIPRALRPTISVMRHPPTIVDGPSSYEIQANQSDCPPDMSVHEFSAYQKLLAGKVRRWPNILVEMNSPNLNFSNDDTMRTICQLAVQAGPWLPGEPLRAAHVVFKEPAFVERLVEMIETRLHSIQANWREHSCMELLVTLSLRIFSLSSGTWQLRAESLLEIARNTTLNWTECLRREISNAVESESAQRAATYGFLAALLCRRTFATYVKSDQAMGIDALAVWIQASVALQDSLMTDISKLPHDLKNMLIRDTKMAYDIRPVLEEAVTYYPLGVSNGIGRSWSNSAGGISTKFSSWKFCPPPHDRWVYATMSERQQGYNTDQVLHCNIIEGHLLVNGKPRGKLPLEIRDDPVVKRLFEDKHLVTYQSSLPGMSHRLVGDVNEHVIHFGIRKGQVIIRACKDGCVLEFVPEAIFSGLAGFDLPAELVEGRVHWLNLTTGRLAIRQPSHIWIDRQRDWVINVVERVACRGKVRLVDPKSPLFSRVVEIMRHFEEPKNLTVYQPHKGPLWVALRGLGLSFTVNPNGMLWSDQLKAEIDPNQDAGTWYGLQSKIVLRDVLSGLRSIIVPLSLKGTQYRRRGVHVEVRIISTQEYGIYKINDILGQLSCPPEPRLVYMKALCHAMTSFCLPDRLTGRTGTEEAFSILRSAVAQPWFPLANGTHPILKDLESLAPKREYYPLHSKRLQSVKWNKQLTTTIQHDEYECLVRDVLERSRRLYQFAIFAAKDFESKDLGLNEPTHLRQRGQIRRGLYERSTKNTAREITPDTVYISRDREATGRVANVYEIARMLLNSCAGFHLTSKIVTILESSQFIGGFQSGESPLSSRLPLISQIEDPIPEQWGSLVDFCRCAESTGPVLFRLGLLAFHPSNNMDMIRALAAFFVLDDLRKLQPPPHSIFVDFELREKPSVRSLELLVRPTYPTFKEEYRHKKGWRDSAGRNAQQHVDLCEKEAIALASHVLRQWPTPADEILTGTLQMEVIDIPSALLMIESEWERRRINLELEGYMERVQTVLDSLDDPRGVFASIDWRVDTDPVFIGIRQPQVAPTLAGVLADKYGPHLKMLSRGFQSRRRSSGPPITKNEVPREITELEAIINHFESSAQVLRRQYAGDLRQSLASLKSKVQSTDVKAAFSGAQVSMHIIEKTCAAIKLGNERISGALDTNDSRSMWLRLGALWPCTAPTSLLEVLRSTSSVKLGARMRKALVVYGVNITFLQRLYRIQYAFLQGNTPALTEELRNPGHENWQPLQQPDWLLLEIDGDFLIRSEQVEVARAIMAPKSGQNSVVQMNMGKGKTSCIMPMVAALLADGQNLVRLIVPKALLTQTAQVMQSRLGGLVGREVRHIPFSRKTPTTPEMLESYAKLHQEIHGARGVILTSHEHVLSYKLGGWQLLADGKLDEAGNMIGFQRWMNDRCRDVLDECDFTLSVKTQLNYPSGRELAVDGHPFRWKVAQVLLALVASHIPALQRDFPSSVEVLDRPGSFPMVHFLKSDVEDALNNRLLDDICAGRTTFLRPASLSFFRWQKTIRHFLSAQKPESSALKEAAGAFMNPQLSSTILLVVRGLLTNRILILCLNKRWNVQYGLHPDRHPVAVPFEAKGIPSELSEFGHPDVAIIFTCLAFYYSGLTPKQFSQGLQQILQSDDAASQYELWISGCNSLPGTLRQWNVIHVEDAAQVEKLWTHLHLDRYVINHYLNHFVFPVHAKQFDVKLQTSAWDLTLFTKTKEQGARTTGFSGTNDNRTMLPLTIRQDDLPSLRQTSAEVLSYLLQLRNRGYEVTSDFRGKRLTEQGLLRKLVDSRIRILIDAGAYILEMDNRTLANAWLQRDSQAVAAVYFANDNRAWVHYRDERKSDTPLLATPFADDLRECVIYLDQAHTRGVDLKFPADARGALTLALKQTKDYTMQAAMRLRQLGTTQSITFFAPPEVDQSIRDFCRPASHERLASPHVISWLLEQTCCTNEDLQSLYVAQGIDFCRRTDAEWRCHDFLVNSSHRTQLLDALRQPEHLTLQQLYGGSCAGSPTRNMDSIVAPQLRAFAKQLAQPNGEHNSLQIGAFDEVEQEREVQVQVEQVRQVQKPPRYKALEFPGLHQSISKFARTGVLEDVTPGNGHGVFEHAFAYVGRSKIGKKHQVCSTKSRLFISKEFGRTVAIGNKPFDNFIRPVEWILWSPITLTALVVTSEEAELLIPILRLAGGLSPTHLIAYAAPVTKAMMSFNSFRYYTVPPLPSHNVFPDWLRVEVGILAGRLYLEATEYDSVLQFLGLASIVSNGVNVVPNGAPEGRAEQETTDGGSSAEFAENSSSFVLEWLTLRRKTNDIMYTPMGHLCRGQKPR